MSNRKAQENERDNEGDVQATANYLANATDAFAEAQEHASAHRRGDNPPYRWSCSVCATESSSGRPD